jgi:hypothetical protein
MLLATLIVATGVRAQGTGTAAGGDIPALKITAVDDKLAPVGWRRYQIGEPVAFSAIFPKQPAGESGRVSGNDGSMIVRTYFAPTETALYGVVYTTDLEGAVEIKTEEQKKKSFNDFIHGFANGFLGVEMGKENPRFSITAERQVKVSGLDAYEKEFVLGDYLGRSQLLFMGPKKCAVIVLWNENNPLKERTTFFSAFTVNPQR